MLCKLAAALCESGKGLYGRMVVCAGSPCACLICHCWVQLWGQKQPFAAVQALAWGASGATAAAAPPVFLSAPSPHPSHYADCWVWLGYGGPGLSSSWVGRSWRTVEIRSPNPYMETLGDLLLKHGPLPCTDVDTSVAVAREKRRQLST